MKKYKNEKRNEKNILIMILPQHIEKSRLVPAWNIFTIQGTDYSSLDRFDKKICKNQRQVYQKN